MNLCVEAFPAQANPGENADVKTQAAPCLPPEPSFPWRLWDSWKLILQIPGCQCASGVRLFEISHAPSCFWGGGGKGGGHIVNFAAVRVFGGVSHSGVHTVSFWR